MPVAPVFVLPPLRYAFADGMLLFNGLVLSLGPGLHWLQGESGSGKTTLLRLLGAALPGLGAALFNGQTLHAGSPAWRQAVCWLDPSDPALDGLTPAALMALALQRHAQLDTAAWRQHIAGFGLAPHAHKTLHMLSTGMRRQAALAAVLAAGASLSLLDEPLAGLDGPAGQYLLQALSALGAQPQRAVLMACGSWPAGLANAGTVLLDAPADQPRDRR